MSLCQLFAQTTTMSQTDVSKKLGHIFYLDLTTESNIKIVCQETDGTCRGLSAKQPFSLIMRMDTFWTDSIFWELGLCAFKVEAYICLMTYLWRGPTLGQAQLKMILHCSEEILETFGGTIQEALKKRLLRKSKQIKGCACVWQTSADFNLVNLFFSPLPHFHWYKQNSESLFNFDT